MKYKNFIKKDWTVYNIDETISEIRSGYIYSGVAEFTKTKSPNIKINYQIGYDTDAEKGGFYIVSIKEIK